MHAITGMTGKVGSALARRLIAGGQTVRAVVRDAGRAAGWAALGCEIAIAGMDDAAALAAAFTGAEGVFILPPPIFDPAPGYPEMRRVAAAVAAALLAARPDRVVQLSTVGADADEDNLLSQQGLMEAALAATGLPVTFLRPGWFMDNALWDVAAAREEGVLRSHLQPADRRIPMVASADVGRLAARLLGEHWSGTRVVELEGPARVSPDDLAAAFARALGRAVRVETVPRDRWEAEFRAAGMAHPEPRMRMIDGFNAGWIDFPGGAAERGTTTLDAVIAGLVAAAG